ncbi:hypothetical protein EYF80_063487 [Liparis tanakae]|uniref:Uncharacterized protein n=1 Tax=Liparis tanakae TaxID=230148 RepID=A0A4Z2ECZ0_9TELE|nr:hypothetical protein EYF80_063487 [Liparis tanakae]
MVLRREAKNQAANRTPGDLKGMFEWLGRRTPCGRGDEETRRRGRRGDGGGEEGHPSSLAVRRAGSGT